MVSSVLVACGLIGATLDILLHVLQLHDIPLLRGLQDKTAQITLLSAILIGLSMVVQFNAGALLLTIFIAGLAITSMVTGKPLDGGH